MKKDWELKKIIDVCLVTDYVANGSFASLSANVKYNYEKDFAVLVRTTDYVKNWKKDFVYVSEDAYKFLNKSKLFVDDIVISNVGEPGITFKIPDLGQPMTLGPNSILVRSLDKKKLTQEYLYYLFFSEYGQSLLESITTGTAQKKFNKTNFRELEIPIPPIDEQNKLVDILDKAFISFEVVKKNTEKKLLVLKDLKKSFLQKAFSGELKV
jgi:type I restriction enzyme S subunit